MVDPAGNDISHRPADTVVEAGGDQVQLIVVSGTQIEQAALSPVVHNIMAAEQRYFIGISHLTQDALIPVEVDDGIGLTRELHVHEHHLDPGTLPLVQHDHLVHEVPRQAIGGGDHHDVERRPSDLVAQGIQARPPQPRAKQRITSLTLPRIEPT